MRHLFPRVVSYSRFVELDKEVAICLHLVINDRGEILNFMITPGNTDDREPLRDSRYMQDIKGKLCGDRGYICRAFFELLFINGIQLVTRVRNNMRNMLMSAEDGSY